VDPDEAAARREELEEAEAFLAEAGIEARAVAGIGDPADAIVDEAGEWGADLIVVGTRGLGGARRLLLGSVSTKVVHHAPCDVLVVR
jgi:nucleotide-binding universal stress UspA family protein